MVIHAVWLIAMLFIGIVLAAFVIGIVLLATHRPAQPVPAAGPSTAPGAETPLDVLARRFAKGEITAEEYQKARDLLKQ